jgi:hypothetical protein
MEFIDLSVLSFFVPLLSFLIVFLLTFAIFQKAKLFENKGWQIFTAFLIATVFVSAVGPTKYISAIVPWFAVFVVAFVLLLAIIGFIGAEKIPGLSKGIGVVFVLGLLAVFLISGIFVFSNYGGTGSIWSWLSSSRIYGALLLLVIAGVVSWFLAKSK